MIPAALRIALAALALLAPAVHAASESSPDALIDALVGRLEYMRDVAAWKRRQNLPVEDPARERAVLADAVEHAKRMGLDADSTVLFLRAQIDAAKEAQRAWNRRWDDGETPPGSAVDLSTVREAISAVSRDVIRVLAITLPDLPREIPDRLQREGASLGLTPSSVTALYDAATSVRYAADGSGTLLDYVPARGVLRVGTTGDYRPFSYRRDDGALAGVDIEMAGRLARSLDVRVHWVKTSWPSLRDDLLRRRYDIAMSGVSRELFRQRDGLFSVPYHEGGKTPIARCEDASRYGGLAAIDRPGVRVIVNPGGTNERFVREHLRNAAIVNYADNASIFDELVAGRADVMITDAVEVRLQAALRPELCATMPGQTLSYSAKAYWMPRDPIFLEYVNAFLEQARADGTLDGLFSRYLPLHPAREARSRRRGRPPASR